MELHHGGTRGFTEETGWDLTAAVIGGALKVHPQLGPGLLESVYEECLCRELHMGRLRFERQVQVPTRYDGIALATGPRIDLLVERSLIIEVKSVEKFAPMYEAQLLSYLRLTGKRLGHLLNVNVSHMRDGGIRRKIP